LLLFSAFQSAPIKKEVESRPGQTSLAMTLRWFVGSRAGFGFLPFVDFNPTITARKSVDDASRCPSTAFESLKLDHARSAIATLLHRRLFFRFRLFALRVRSIKKASSESLGDGKAFREQNSD
jgi:hypothetical protein